MRKALIDANLLVLLAIGSLDRDLIGTHKRTDKLTPEDFDALLTFLSPFGIIHTTPHCLAEASNLLAQSGAHKRRLLLALGALLTSVIEVYVPSEAAVTNACYPRLGLTDATLAHAAASGCEVLTLDLDLYLWVLESGYTAFNFNHVRTGAWT